MVHLGTTSGRPGRGGRAIRNFVTIMLVCLVNFSLGASTPRAEGEVIFYRIIVTPLGPRLCPGKEGVFLIEVNGYRAKSEEVIIGANGEVEIKEGAHPETWPVPGVEIDISQPKLGKVIKKEPMISGPFGSFSTSEGGIAHATYKAEKTGEESIQFKFTGLDLRTKQIFTKAEIVTFRVWPCLIIPILNLFADAQGPKGARLSAFGTGGGEAHVDDEGKLTGDGEIAMGQFMDMPEQCTDAESSGNAPFTIKGELGEDTMHLEFVFDALSRPAASSTCTAKGFAISTPIFPANSGDPAIVLGFHDLTVPIGGGTATFPFTIPGYTGGTTIAVTLIREESASSSLDPLFAMGAFPMGSWR